MRRYLLASLVSAALIAMSTSPAGASVTIGQTDPSLTPMAACVGVNPQDMAQPSVTSGDSYVVPADGTITSWSHNAYNGANQNVSLKVWRLISGTSYQVVGHNSETFSGPGLISFSGISVPVQAGDVLGLNAGIGGSVDCMFPAPGDTMLYANASNTPDGQTTNFTTVPDRRPNISAVVEPDCDKDGLGDQTQDTDLSSCAPGTTTSPAPGGATCKGKLATIVGTDGNDVRTGSPGPDVIAGLGGNDTLSGLAGDDVICGGPGKDTLKGGKGKDTLLGQAGKDTLNGGGGQDFCKGGKSRDTASKCEVKKSI